MSGPSTQIRQFVGMNIKGTPAMRAPAVDHDLRVAKRKADVVALQEFRWPWYWRTARRVLEATRAQWASFPGYDRGLAHPVFGAQGLLWKGRLFEREGSRMDLLHDGEAKISEDRYLRAVLLKERLAKLSCWFGSTHFVVNGDNDHDGPVRRRMFRLDLERLDRFLGELVETGHPVIFQMDGNVRKGSDRYDDFVRVLKKHGAQIHGAHGVEWLFTIDGRDGVDVVVERAWQVPTSQLKTDHEGRGIDFRLVQRPQKP